MKTRTKVLLGIGAVFVTAAILGIVFPSEGRNNEFQPQNEFKLDPWFEIKLGPIDMSLTKAVLYLFLACGLTTIALTYVAKRMADRPNRVQTAVEATCDLARKEAKKIAKLCSRTPTIAIRVKSPIPRNTANVTRGPRTRSDS